MADYATPPTEFVGDTPGADLPSPSHLCDRYPMLNTTDATQPLPVVSESHSARRPVVIDLFSGAGGLSLGFEIAGFDVLSAVEYDPVHAATHLYNFPLTDVLCRDIRAVTADMLVASAERGWAAHNPDSKWDGVVDVIVGGPSCQGFSRMGKQDVNDDRNQLINEFVRIVVALRPRAFCMENVPGFLDPRFGVLRTDALARLRSAGYAISGDTTALSAVEFGVPQTRSRVVIMGLLDGDAPSIPTADEAREFTVADAFAGLPVPSQYPSSLIGDTIKLTKSAHEELRRVENAYVEYADLVGDNSARNGHARIIDGTVLSGCKATIHTDESKERFAATAQGSTEEVSRNFRLALDRASRTLRAGTGRERGAFSASRPLHPIEPRVITVREAARLHSFPDWFRFHTTNWHGHRQVGNAVPPLLAAAAGASIMAALDISPIRSSRDPIRLGDEALLSLSPTEAAKHLGAEEAQVPQRRTRPKAGTASEIVTVEDRSSSAA